MDLVEAHVGDAQNGIRHPWERARLTLAMDLIARHAPLRPGDVVLDIGCGDVFVVESLARRYPDVRFYAVDSAFTDVLIAAIQPRLRSHNVTLTASLDTLPRQPAALILLMDVIEHVPDDQSFLQSILERGLLGPDTRLLITVPSFPGLFSEHDRFLGHYRRYTRATLRAVVESLSLRVIDDGYFFASLVPARAWQLLKERLGSIPEQSGVGRWGGGETMGGLVSAVLTGDGRLSMWLKRHGVSIPGLSNFAICRASR